MLAKFPRSKNDLCVQSRAKMRWQRCSGPKLQLSAVCSSARSGSGEFPPLHGQSPAADDAARRKAAANKFPSALRGIARKRPVPRHPQKSPGDRIILPPSVALRVVNASNSFCGHRFAKKLLLKITTPNVQFANPLSIPRPKLSPSLSEYSSYQTE